jgi:signal transduction histidine kinase
METRREPQTFQPERRGGVDRRRNGGEQARLRTIVERMADGVVIVSQEGLIRFANPAAERLFGRSLSELSEREFGFPVVVGDTTEVEVVRPQQQTVTAELRTVDTEWEAEPAYLISLRDVTDRKRAEERAAQLDRERLARIEAEAASQAKSDFLALMSHELRTPLNAVLGYAELLDMGVGGALSPEQRQHVTRIAASGQHLLGLVNEVLDLAKVEAGQLALEHGVGRSREAGEQALALVLPMAESRGITLTAAAEGNGDAVFQGDDNRVRQILVNLLNNAVKFTAAGGRVTLTWGRTAKPDRDARLVGARAWHYFRVADTGVGIPPDKLTAIFDPFVQVEGGHARRAEGSGLGLAISRRLARLMKGDLTVRSEMGRGSTFTLWLPDAGGMARTTARGMEEHADVAARLQGLAEVGTVLLRQLDPLLEAFVTRLQDEPIVEGAGDMRDCQLTGHLGAFVADVACTLAAIEESGGEPSVVVADAAPIQAAIAERHGAERAQLGWTPNLVAREWMILCDEMKRVIRLGARGLTDQLLEEAFHILDRAVEQATEVSVRALNRAANNAPASELIRLPDEPEATAG